MPLMQTPLCESMEKRPIEMIVPTRNQRLREVGSCTSLLFVLTSVPTLCCAAQGVPGEAKGSFFHTVTHLHPLVYVILSVIFILSAINLIAQGWLSGTRSPFFVFFQLWGRLWGGAAGTTVLRGLKSRKLEQGQKRRSAIEKAYRYGGQPMEDSVVSVRRLSNVAAQNARASIPTPLDGVNHPLPELTSQMVSGTGAPRIVESKTESKPPATEFKFTSAVDLPSPEEIERREKTQMVVSGCVRDLEGKGIGSVIVYLTDEQGNRLGQSCRSAPDTGEFKVLAAEAGKYRLGGYKRGYVMENVDPIPLPIEAGKIEQFNFVMRAEGCEVRGKVLVDPGGQTLAGYEVKCDCRRDDFTRSDYTNGEGEFQILGVPLDSECTLSLLKPDGTLVSRSEPFQTVQKKEIYREIRVTFAEAPTPEAPSASEDPARKIENNSDMTDQPGGSAGRATASQD